MVNAVQLTSEFMKGVSSNMKTKLSIILIISITVALMMAGCGGATTGPEVGNKAPDFNLQTIDGQSLGLSDFHGRPVMVSFWATWCGPCMDEMPYIQAVYDGHSDEELVVFTINIRESAEAARAVVNREGLTFPVLIDSQAMVAEQYQVQFIPMTFFIDAKGVIKARKVGGFQSQEEIEGFIKDI